MYNCKRWLSFFCCSSMYESNRYCAKLMWHALGVTYFARDPLHSYFDEYQKNEIYFLNVPRMANSADPDQTAPSVWCGSTLFAQTCLSEALLGCIKVLILPLIRCITVLMPLTLSIMLGFLLLEISWRGHVACPGTSTVSDLHQLPALESEVGSLLYQLEMYLKNCITNCHAVSFLYKHMYSMYQVG